VSDRRPRRGSALLALAAVLLAARAEAASPPDDSVEVQTECFDAHFALEGARPTRLITRASGASAPAAPALDLARPYEPDPLRVVGDGDAGLEARLVQLRYAVERREDAQAVTLIFRAALEPGIDVVQRYGFARQTCSIDVALELAGEPAGRRRLALDLAATSAFAPRAVAGLGSLSEHLRAVDVGPEAARELDPASGFVELSSGRWLGVRSRHWAFLASAVEHPARIRVRGQRVELRASGAEPLQVRLYAGPIERSALGAVDPSLERLLFTDRSAPIRALCIGLAALLAVLLGWVGHAWLAVVLLSPVVKLLLWPLTRIAERWQREVDDVRTRLAPRLAEIRARYRGEERSRRALELHRELGVPTFYGLKGLLGVAIQLPVFIAVFHVLDESIALLGAPLLWIEDLSLPDRLSALPFGVPFFGDGLNLLPFIMTAVTLVANRLHRGGPRDPELRMRQRRGLDVMAAAFFLLFYTFPAAMVLYWTANNLSALLLDALRDRFSFGTAPLRAASE
jgi:YidC/Oxa1 family membrane protein insertase